MSWGIYRWHNPQDGTFYDVDVDALPTTTEPPNVPRPNLHIDPASGEVSRVELPGFWIDPAEVAASPNGPWTLHRSTTGNN